MRRLQAMFLVSALSLLTAAKYDKLEPREQTHLRALEVFMEKDQIKAFYKLKTPAERDAWLKEAGLWDRFYQYDEAARAEIVAGEVRVGFGIDQLFMAWGAPYAKNRLTGRPAQRSERLVYRFEVDDEGFATPLGRKKDYKAVDRFQMEVVVDDNIVTEIDKKSDWE
jgi:hypothetical protein